MEGRQVQEHSLPSGWRKVAVVGQGHVGIRLAMAAAEVGFEVVGFDTDEHLVKELLALEDGAFRAGVPASGGWGVGPLRAALDGVDAVLLGSLLASGSYRPTSDEEELSGFDVGLVAVPTPVQDDGTPDLSALQAAAGSLGRHLRRGAAVSVESTVFPGVTREVVAPALEAASGLVAGVDFRLGYSPERIDTGNPVASLASTPKLVSGIDQASLQELSSFYQTFVEQVVEVPGTEEAELAKLIENTFRQVNVALVNEVALAAGAMGIDVRAALEAAATKPFGYMAFLPGPGTGGRCLSGAAGHLAFAARRAGQRLDVVEAAGTVNASMPRKVAARLASALAGGDERGLAGKRILILGLAYKAGVGETKGSPAVAVANALASLGAEVVASDPLVADCPELDPGVLLLEGAHAGASPGASNPPASIPGSGATRGGDTGGDPASGQGTADLLAESALADAVVVLVDHPAFDLDAIGARARLVVDARYRLSGRNVLFP